MAGSGNIEKAAAQPRTQPVTTAWNNIQRDSPFSAAFQQVRNNKHA